MRYLILLLIIVSISTFAEIYMTVDKEGVPTYSDTPTKGAKEVGVLPENNILPSQPPDISSKEMLPINNDKSQSTVNNFPQANIVYSNFQIVSPKDRETIQNQPTLMVQVKVEPDLIKGDKIVLLLDNKETGLPQEGMKFNVVNIDRGIHQLQAKLLGKNGEVLKETNTITIFVHRASTNFPKPPT